MDINKTENKNEEKPLSLIIAELRINIENAINSSGLSPCIVEPILKDYYNQVLILSNETYNNDKKQYMKNSDDLKEETK